MNKRVFYLGIFLLIFTMFFVNSVSASTFMVRLIDQDGNPVPNATMKLSVKDNQYGGSSGNLETKTTDSGGFAIFNQNTDYDEAIYSYSVGVSYYNVISQSQAERTVNNINMTKVRLNPFVSIYVNLSANTFYPAIGDFCQEDQEMFRITSSTNAHSQLVSGEPAYKYNLCYDSIFGSIFDSSKVSDSNLVDDVNYCTGDNNIISLSSSTNAHAEIPDSSTSIYSTDVCYGTLSCRSTESSCDASKREKEIIRLYGDTNSHVAIAKSGFGSYAVCCKTRGEITDAWWENSAGNKVSQSNSGVGLKLIASGNSLEGINIEYTIEKKQGTSWKEVTKIKGDAGSLERGEASYTPTVTGDTYYRFKASIYDSSDNFNVKTITSNEILIKKAGANNPPVACIKAPENGQIFIVNEEVSFTECSSDSDGDVLSYIWDFADGQTSTTKEPKHTFSSSGQKSVKLNVSDGSTSKSTKVEILIINSEFAFSFISNPAHNSVIKSSTITFDGGSKSYIVNVTEHDSSTGKPKTITCLAGNCPSSTSGSTQVSISNTPNLAGFSNVNFSWTLSNEYKIGGINNQSFKHTFSSPGNYRANLMISLFGRAGVYSSSYSDFSLDFGFPYCKLEKDLTESYWFEDGNKNPSENDCKRNNGQPTTTCCPSEYYCDEVSGGWKCAEGGDNDPKQCSDYSSETTCEEDGFHVAIGDAESNLKSIYSDSKAECGGFVKDSTGKLIEITNCRCEWSSSSCKVNWGEGTQTGGGSEGTCNINLELKEDQCSALERIRTYEQTATWEWAAGSSKSSSYPEKIDCEDKDGKTIDVECTYFSRVELPFFGLANFAVAALLIFSYYFIRMKKK